jgi:hypothetical protein
MSGMETGQNFWEGELLEGARNAQPIHDKGHEEHGAFERTDLLRIALVITVAWFGSFRGSNSRRADRRVPDLCITKTCLSGA